MNNEERFVFPPENMFIVLDTMKECSDLLEKCETQDLCEIYAKLFPIKDGVYELSDTHLKALCHAVFDKTSLELVDKGLLELMWNDEANEFAFRLTEYGKRVAENEKTSNN
jgi:hypothetical protein